MCSFSEANQRYISQGSAAISSIDGGFFYTFVIDRNKPEKKKIKKVVEEKVNTARILKRAESCKRQEWLCIVNGIEQL